MYYQVITMKGAHISLGSSGDVEVTVEDLTIYEFRDIIREVRDLRILNIKNSNKATNDEDLGVVSDGLMDVLKNLINEGYFATSRKTADVCDILNQRGIEFTSTLVSVYLKRLSENGLLDGKKLGGKMEYINHNQVGATGPEGDAS